MKKSFVLVAALVGAIGVSLAFSTNDEPFKNLKVLPRNITKQQLDSVMRHFTNALNVKCGFCHVRDTATKKMDWASDGNKHKLIARGMMSMTNEINDKYFLKGEQRTIETPLTVTCYTCHRGATEPAVRAAVDSTKK